VCTRELKVKVVYPKVDPIPFKAPLVPANSATEVDPRQEVRKGEKIGIIKFMELIY
jgi:hypothetical protein